MKIQARVMTVQLAVRDTECNDKKVEFVDATMMFIDKLEEVSYRLPR